MYLLKKHTFLLLGALALVFLLGACSSYNYYNRYPKPKKCDCPSFSRQPSPSGTRA